jgi:ACR3 family arsenite efflux pump ArsB
MKNITNKYLILKTAKKRVHFKKHITIYILLNLLLWVIFLFLFRGKHANERVFLQINLFILCIWTILIIGHYFYAIKWNKKMIDKEVQSILKETEADKN